MSPHTFILTLFLILAAIGAAFFIHLYRVSCSTEGPGLKKVGAKRLFTLVLLLAVFLILLSVTLPKSPYYRFTDVVPEKTVHVTAMQYTYMMSYDAFKPDMSDYKPPEGGVITLPAGKPVEFRVTSADVNHGFAIYNDKFELVTQTQAMPYYVNRLRWQFDKPGTYTLLCLEFCSSGHPAMRGMFTVK